MRSFCFVLVCMYIAPASCFSLCLSIAWHPCMDGLKAWLPILPLKKGDKDAPNSCSGRAVHGHACVPMSWLSAGRACLLQHVALGVFTVEHHPGDVQHHVLLEASCDERRQASNTTEAANRCSVHIRDPMPGAGTPVSDISRQHGSSHVSSYVCATTAAHMDPRCVPCSIMFHG